MTATNPIKQQQIKRMGELAEISRQRYLDAGGDPLHSTNGHEWMNEDEKQEYLMLARQVFDRESVNNYIKNNGTWQERFERFKTEMKAKQ